MKRKLEHRYLIMDQGPKGRKWAEKALDALAERGWRGEIIVNPWLMIRTTAPPRMFERVMNIAGIH